MYNIAQKSFDAAFRTFAEVFPHATFWYVRGHGLFVAGKDPIRIDCRRMREAFRAPAVAADFASIDVLSAEQFMGFLLMDPEHIARYLDRNQDRQIVTDDNSYLEYQTPFEFMGGTEAIVPDLIASAGWSGEELFAADCSSEFRDAARSAFWERLARIPIELREPVH
jgi:hypothetical protein